MGPHEPYWRTNTSFSPPPTRWDFRFQSEGPYGSHDGISSYGSSASSNSKESRSWLRRSQLYDHQFSASDGAGLFLSSPSDLSQGPQWTPPAVQEISIDDYETVTRRVPILRQLSLTSTMEGTSANPDSAGSTSSRSDSSESEHTIKPHISSHRNFSSCRYFMSKPIHPLSFPSETQTREALDSAAARFTDFGAATSQRGGHRSSSASSSMDFTDVSEPFESEIVARPCITSDGFKCGLCERFLSQRSPWSSRRIVRSGDMPVAGVLCCRHVFHAECLEHTTPKTRRSDPPCPLCTRQEDDNCPDQPGLSRWRSGCSRLRPFSEDGPSRPWGCVQMGDCVEGALHTPSRNAMFLLNRSRLKKNLSLKGSSSKDFPGKLRRNGSYTMQMLSGKSVDQGTVGCSKTMADRKAKRSSELK